jgi:hypothetical protein
MPVRLTTPAGSFVTLFVYSSLIPPQKPAPLYQLRHRGRGYYVTSSKPIPTALSFLSFALDIARMWKSACYETGIPFTQSPETERSVANAQ